MYPPSPYAVPIGSFQRPVALPTTDPKEGPLFYIGINCEWMPLVAGALKQLLLQATWDTTDVTHLERVQGQVFDLISKFNCATAPTLAQLCPQIIDFGCECGEEDSMWRQDGCKLIMSCNGVDTFTYDPSACIAAGTSQPPPGGSPAPGACLVYDVTLQASSKWQLPVAVDNGDTITISGAQGGWSDGTINPWHCPDGDNYLLGICVGGSAGFDGADPVPSQFHMRLVALTSMQGYDAFNTTIGIIGLGSPDSLTFQANDATLSDNAGSVSFRVTICKAQPSPVALTYAAGSGPATVTLPTTIVVDTADFGGGAAEVVFNTDRAVKATVIGFAGDYVDNSSCPTYVWYYVDPLGGVHNSGCPHASVVPTDMPPGSALTEFRSQGELTHQYQITILLEEP